MPKFDVKKLKILEAHFFNLYPKGFEDEQIQAIIKKHNTAKIGESVRKMFAPDNFAQPQPICENFAKIASQSTLISLFEKPKVRETVKQMSIEQKDALSHGLYELLHGKKESGFCELVDILARYGLAKWSIVTLLPYYYARDKEIFVKPNTTKDIINYFEIAELSYKPKPSYEFYAKYKEVIDGMKSLVDESLGRDNAGFTGFLMMTMRD